MLETSKSIVVTQKLLPLLAAELGSNYLISVRCPEAGVGEQLPGHRICVVPKQPICRLECSAYHVSMVPADTRL